MKLSHSHNIWEHWVWGRWILRATFWNVIGSPGSLSRAACYQFNRRMTCICVSFSTAVNTFSAATSLIRPYTVLCSPQGAHWVLPATLCWSATGAKAPGSTLLCQQGWGGWNATHSRVVPTSPPRETWLGHKIGWLHTQKNCSHGERDGSGPLPPPQLCNSRLCSPCLPWLWLWGPLCPAPSAEVFHHLPSFSSHVGFCFLLISLLYQFSPPSHISFPPFHIIFLQFVPPTSPTSSSSKLHPKAYILTRGLVRERATGLINYS